MEWGISSVFSGEGCADDSDVCSGEVTCTATGDVWFVRDREQAQMACVPIVRWYGGFGLP